MFRLESRSSVFTPANLNPRHSGSALAKILEGKYPLTEVETKDDVPANRIVSKITAEKEKDLDRVSNNESQRGIGTPQRNPSSGIGTHRKVDLPFPLPSSQEVSRPLAPNPYGKTSWLAIEIEKLLNKKSRMANSKFKFEVNPEAASSNFKQLA